MSGAGGGLISGPMVHAPLQFRLAPGGRSAGSTCFLLCPRCDAPAFIRRSERKTEQVTQMDRRVALHLFRILLPHLIGRLVAGHLQHMHRGRFPGVGFAAGARLVKTTDGQRGQARGPAQRVHLFSLALDATDTDAADPAGHAGEVLGAHRAAQPHPTVRNRVAKKSYASHRHGSLPPQHHTPVMAVALVENVGTHLPHAPKLHSVVFRGYT